MKRLVTLAALYMVYTLRFELTSLALGAYAALTDDNPAAQYGRL